MSVGKLIFIEQMIWGISTIGATIVAYVLFKVFGNQLVRIPFSDLFKDVGLLSAGLWLVVMPWRFAVIYINYFDD